MSLNQSPVRDALIEHALHADVPDSARRSAMVFLEDTLLVGLAGSASPERGQLLAAASNWGDQGPAKLWGDGREVSTATAALVNAYQIHCQEYDCVHEPAVVHPMAVIGGALVSWAQAHGGFSARQLLDAICVAVDGATVLGMMARTPMRFFRPAMCGALGASLGLARLTGMSSTEAQRALGLCYCQIGGNMQAHLEGTSGMALQVGFNARAAVTATELTVAGISGPLDVIDGPFGYLTLIEGEYDSSPIAALGQEWQIERVSHKPFPTGRAAHATLDGLSRLISSGVSTQDIVQVELHAPALIRRLVDRPARSDMSPNYARLCLPWLVSVFLSRGSLGLEDCDAPALADPERWSRIDGLTIRADDNPDPNALTPQRLRVETRDGEQHSIDLPAVLGSPERPLDLAERDAKAQACWRYAGISDERGPKLLNQVRQMDQATDLNPIFDLLTRP